MNFNQSFFTPLISLVFLLGACTSGEKTTTAESPVSSATTTAQTTAQSGGNHDANVSQGGQVVETGSYHLELVTLKEASGMHLDFFLQKGDTHEAIPNAKVTGQIQLPDGTLKTVEFEYDTAGKHYAAILPETAPGDYKIAILTDIQGEKVNGRFNFKQ